MAVRKSLSIEDANITNTAIVTTTSKPYSDIDLSFVSKDNGDVFKKIDVSAVKQAVKTLIQTNHGEKPFDFYFGANIRSLLFEPVTIDTIDKIQLNVRLAMLEYEPRAKLIDVRVLDELDRNSVNVSVRFKIVNTNEEVSIETSFSRLR